MGTITISVDNDTEKRFRVFEHSTPERLIAGIVAGLTSGIDAGDCACCFEGFGVCAGIFSGCWLG